MRRLFAGFILAVFIPAVFIVAVFTLGSAGWVCAQTSLPTQALSGSSNSPTTTANSSVEAAGMPSTDPRVLLPEPIPLPPGKTTLIGGTIKKLDRIRDEMQLQIVAGRTIKVYYDGRTHVYRDGLAQPPGVLRRGDRIHVDTMLEGTTIFARNINVSSGTASGESTGQLLSYDVTRGELSLRDAVSPQPIKVRLAAGTTILLDGAPVAANSLRAGSLVAVKFEAGAKGRSSVAREISVLAVPGSHFTFAGVITHLDLHSGFLVLTNAKDNKSYEITFDPAITAVDAQWKEGAEASIDATFEGEHYLARGIQIRTQKAAQP